MKRILLSLAFVVVALQSSCGGSTAKLDGHYVNAQYNDVTLDVSGNTFAGHQGPMTISATYRVLSESGSTLTVEFTAPTQPKDVATIQVADGTLTISSKTPFNGTWKRK